MRPSRNPGRLRGQRGRSRPGNRTGGHRNRLAARCARRSHAARGRYRICRCDPMVDNRFAPEVRGRAPRRPWLHDRRSPVLRRVRRAGLRRIARRVNPRCGNGHDHPNHRIFCHVLPQAPAVPGGPDRRGMSHGCPRLHCRRPFRACRDGPADPRSDHLWARRMSRPHAGNFPVHRRTADRPRVSRCRNGVHPRPHRCAGTRYPPRKNYAGTVSGHRSVPARRIPLSNGNQVNR